MDDEGRQSHEGEIPLASRLCASSNGAIAVGALAIGRLAIRRLAVYGAVMKRLRIEELEGDRLKVHKLIGVDQEQRSA